MTCVNMTCQDTRHPDKRRRHQGRAICEVAGQRFEARSRGLVYKLSTLLWLHGHGGEEFEVYDDLSPFGNPGGLAMTGRVRNWARFANGKPVFNKDAPSETDFSPHERDLIVRAAGRVVDLTGTDSPRPEYARTGANHHLDGPEYSQERDRALAAVTGAHTSDAA